MGDELEDESGDLFGIGVGKFLANWGGSKGAEVRTRLRVGDFFLEVRREVVEFTFCFGGEKALEFLVLGDDFGGEFSGFGSCGFG